MSTIPLSETAVTPSAVTLTWKKPTIREIPCGYEINAYASAERKPHA
jgi:coenzyme PQQ precursor peptide PqqA